MDEIKQDTVEPARRSFEVHEDVVMSIPNFSTIERFFLVGGGKANDIYDRMKSLAYPNGCTLVLNIMNKLKNKSSQNLKATQTITDFDGLYRLQGNISKKKYKGASDLIFWVNGSFDLHSVNLSNSIEKLLQTGEERTFNFFESMYPLNIRIEEKKWSGCSISALEFTKGCYQTG